MRLGSRNSGFVFSLPESFITKELENFYKPIMRKNHIPYEKCIHYLNSAIKSVSYPGFSYDTSTQFGVGGKMIFKKPANYSEDLVSTSEIIVTFKSLDNDLNYMILGHIFQYKYDGTHDKQYDPALQLFMLDDYRDVIYSISFKNVLFTSISDNLFDYSQQKITGKEFTVAFKFNWIEIDFPLTQQKILDDNHRPVIVVINDSKRQ